MLYRRDLAFRSEWPSEDVQAVFFKCVRWQVEDTMDPINCPYHYYCDSTYPGNHPPYVDVLAFLFTTALYLVTLAIMVVDISRRGRTYLRKSKRYLQPSGPVSLPLILFVLAKGYRINTVFPLSCFGPAILQLLQVSALTFDCGIDKDVRYAFLQASTISGILHASLYLDSIILPYYTGFDALVSSTFSGECPTCVCRKEVLVVGGRLIRFDLDHRGLHLSNKEKSRTVSDANCCFWRCARVNLPSNDKEDVCSDDPMAFCTCKVRQVGFAPDS
ncbi:hypothetical protein POTOM_048214 [Populus tomentosa]|uniref:Uncharacterized protein n=1 Tax=Populus tomentosa TaxID=118781 RepID=A0A8X8CBN1_POPTO|nr:hypothetical protein POTOM_048214 [Populus tomentosa]